MKFKFFRRKKKYKNIIQKEDNLISKLNISIESINVFIRSKVDGKKWFFPLRWNVLIVYIAW